MKFCSDCGASVVLKIPSGDNRERFVCSQCDVIHYQNPRVITGCLPVWEDQVLLCLRAIEPRRNYWTLPAGFLENSESVADGARRETWEEAKAQVSNLRMYTVFSLPHISQVYTFYLADLDNLDFATGEESLDVRLFRQADIPWDQLAFPVITQSLQHYFADLPNADFPVRYAEINFRRPRPASASSNQES